MSKASTISKRWDLLASRITNQGDSTAPARTGVQGLVQGRERNHLCPRMHIPTWEQDECHSRAGDGLLPTRQRQAFRMQLCCWSRFQRLEDEVGEAASHSVALRGAGHPELHPPMQAYLRTSTWSTHTKFILKKKKICLLFLHSQTRLPSPTVAESLPVSPAIPQSKSPACLCK